MRRLGASICLALSLGGCFDLGNPDSTPSGKGGQSGDASIGVEGGCWQPKYADCDGVTANGCETALDTLENCGACGKVCSAPAHGSASCSSESCVQSCDSGFANCDNDWSNGCESLSSTANCGSCGVPCAGTCTAGTCCKPSGSACSTAAECCISECHAGTCCRASGSDCAAADECCVGYCPNGTCCKPAGVACNQGGTCCSGSCLGGLCT